MGVPGIQMKVVAAFAVIFALLLSGIYLSRESRIGLPSITMEMPRHDGANARSVKCRIAVNIASTSIVRMAIAIPYRDGEQKADLNRNIPRITSDFVTMTDSATIQELIETRDFATLKAALLTSINRYTKEPVHTLYFESLNWW